MDYGARFEACPECQRRKAEIGRWNVVDLLADNYHSYSPYNYALNDSIGKSYPNGMDVEYVNGGVRYTGEDAMAAFESLKSLFGSSGDDQEDPPKKK